MPIYEYRCENRHIFEIMQKMSDDPVTACAQCGAPVERVFHPVAVHFKGSGFYTTDYGSGKATAGDGESSNSKEGSDSGKESSKEGSKEASKESSKPESKDSTKSGSGAKSE